MKSILSPMLTGVLVSLLLAGGPAIAQAPAPASTQVAIGQPLRDAELRGVLGPAKKLSAYRGKPLIINVWASWCAPCRAEMASLERLNRQFGGTHFQMIGISTDDYIERAEVFVKHANTGFPHYIDHQLYLERMLGADRIPLTVLVDARGKVLARYYGAKEWDSPEALQVIGKAFGVKLK